jgi:hypothetical protein
MIAAGKLYISNYLEKILWKLSLQNRFFFQITNCQGFRNNQVNLYEFFLLGMQVQTKIWIIAKFWIMMFRINQVLLYLIFTG